jgi:hypothetical protein
LIPQSGHEDALNVGHDKEEGHQREGLDEEGINGAGEVDVDDQVEEGQADLGEHDGAEGVVGKLCRGQDCFADSKAKKSSSRSFVKWIWQC